MADDVRIERIKISAGSFAVTIRNDLTDAVTVGLDDGTSFLSVEPVVPAHNSETLRLPIVPYAENLSIAYRTGPDQRPVALSPDHLVPLSTDHWYTNPKPFVWHKPAAEIVDKVRRGRAALTHQTNSATDH